jgi:NAD-dependent dihydropyrimidine dehydrogenase PreA subunit
MRRKVIEIDEARCDGCGQCVEACHEGALWIVGGKARLVADALCDGLAACLGECPRGALAIVEREAPAFDAAAVEAARRPPALRVIAGLGGHGGHGSGPTSCPGSALRALPGEPGRAAEGGGQPSALGHWPVQLMLVPPQAPFLVGADLLVCADCVPFAVPDFHARYLAGRAVVVGCPKLDDLGHYAEKLAAMVRAAGPRRLTVARMEVPCCRGLAQAAIRAAQASDQAFPVEEHVVGVRGGIERAVVR